MVKVTVLYGPPSDPAAFEDYYANTHVPLAAKMPEHAGKRKRQVTVPGDRIGVTDPGRDDPDQYLDDLIAIDNAALKDARRPGVTVGMHMCRGNNRSGLARGPSSGAGSKRGWGNRVAFGKPLRLLQDWTARERLRLAI